MIKEYCKELSFLSKSLSPHLNKRLFQAHRKKLEILYNLDFLDSEMLTNMLISHLYEYVKKRNRCKIDKVEISKTLFILLELGFSQKEVAQMLGLNKNDVSHINKEIVYYYETNKVQKYKKNCINYLNKFIAKLNILCCDKEFQDLEIKKNTIIYLKRQDLIEEANEKFKDLLETLDYIRRLNKSDFYANWEDIFFYLRNEWIENIARTFEFNDKKAKTNKALSNLFQQVFNVHIEYNEVLDKNNDKEAKPKAISNLETLFFEAEKAYTKCNKLFVSFKETEKNLLNTKKKVYKAKASNNIIESKRRLKNELDFYLIQNQHSLKTKEVKKYILKKYSLSYTDAHIRKMIRDRGFSLSKP